MSFERAARFENLVLYQRAAHRLKRSHGRGEYGGGNRIARYRLGFNLDWNFRRDDFRRASFLRFQQKIESAGLAV